MTQVQEWSNKQIDVALAKLCGYEIYAEEFSLSHELVVRYVDAKGLNGLRFFSPSTDPAASLEVQTAAIVKDAEKYMRNLAAVRWVRQDAAEMTELSLIGAADLHLASPRERAEAAYITLSSKR
jgi:hypothetical protein